jgi:N-acylglucosamine 2-epimerase
MADLDFLRQCRDQYRNQLVDNIMPFWLKHGLDQINGGVYTCLDRDGTLMDTTKSVWFQGRFGYVAAAAYNQIDQRAEWLVASKSCIDFIEKHCIDTDGHMFFTVSAEGEGIQKRRYVFSECFAIIAMAEFAVASGEKHYGERAFEIFKNMIAMLESPTFLPPKTTVPAIGHSITMMLVNVALILKQVCDSPMLDEQIDKSIDTISTKLLHPEFETILESVTPEGKFIDTCAGRTINPGHCIETGWFILALARSRNWDEKLIKLGTTIIDWAWKWGWDEPYGGMINFRDCRNFPPQDYSQDMKFWWPQCETIIASLYAYIATGDEKYLEMHRKAHEYAFRVFADNEFGEWYGYLHRDGTVAQPAKGNIFKGPFHVPRMMIVASQLCEEILNKSNA